MVKIMKSSRVLLKKCFRDIFKNIKQFLAIIFIIATSVTLFIGLEANYTEFNRRINYVFTSTNMGDIYSTYIPDLESDIDEDLLKIEDIIKDKGTYEKRIYIPSFKFNDKNLNALIYDKIPSISSPYELNTISASDNINFFLIDETVLESQKLLGKEYEIGDYITLSFSETQLESLIDLLIGEDELKINDKVKDLIVYYLGSSDLGITFNNAITNSDSSMLRKSLPSILKDLLMNKSSSKIDFNVQITGTMRHAENIENGNFSNSNFLMSKILFEKLILNRIEENLTFSYLNETLNLFISNGLDSVSEKRLKKNLSKENESYITQSISSKFKEINRNLNNGYELDELKNFYDQIVIKLNDSSLSDEILNGIREYFLSKENNNLILLQKRDDLSSCSTIINDLKQSQMLALSFPLIFFVVAILVVLTTITQLLLKERTQIGTLKALGYSKINILTFYSVMMNIITLIGVILGFIIGPLLLPRIMNIKYDILYSLPSMNYSFPYLAGLIIVSIIIILVTFLTYVLIRQELNLTPVESMRIPSPKIKFKKKKTFIKNTSLMMALRNIKVHLNKSIMVIVGVMGCTGLLICGFGVEDTLNYGINLDLTSFVNGDLNLTYSLNVPFDSNKDELLKIDNIKEVNEYGVGSATILKDNQYSLNYYYISKESEGFKYDNGHEWNNNEIGISESSLEKINAKVGDEIEFKINSNTYKCKIAFSFYSFSFKGIFLYIEDPLFNSLHQNANAATIMLKDNDKINETINLINKNDNIKVETILSKKETNDKIESYVSSIKTMTNTIKVFAIILAVIVLVNLAILNFKERIRETATLRVLGFNLIEIGKSLIYEIMILTLIGSIVGLFLGYPLEFIVLYTNRTELVSYSYTIYGISYFYAIIISLLTAFVVNIYITRKIKKVPMAESLKSIE